MQDGARVAPRRVAVVGRWTGVPRFDRGSPALGGSEPNSDSVGDEHKPAANGGPHAAGVAGQGQERRLECIVRVGARQHLAAGGEYLRTVPTDECLECYRITSPDELVEEFAVRFRCRFQRLTDSGDKTVEMGGRHGTAPGVSVYTNPGRAAKRTAQKKRIANYTKNGTNAPHSTRPVRDTGGALGRFCGASVAGIDRAAADEPSALVIDQPFDGGRTGRRRHDDTVPRLLAVEGGGSALRPEAAAGRCCSSAIPFAGLVVEGGVREVVRCRRGGSSNTRYRRD